MSKKRTDWNPTQGVAGSWQLEDFRGRLAFSLQKTYFSKYDHTYANSPYSFCTLKNMNIPQEKISLIQNGVVVEEFMKVSSPIKEQLGIKGNILMVAGRFVRWKGFDVAIKALKIVLTRYPNTVLIVAGEGEEEERLRKLATKHCPNHVFFVGSIGFDEMVKYYSACDAFLLPSYYDVGMPNVLLEAMSCEAPVIASDISAVKSIIKEEETGYLCIPGDPVSLAERILECFSNKKKAQSVGKAGRKLVKKNFNHKKMVEKIIRLYEKLS
jgi:glycosyltransferase involved in cell wall biosynthesis